MTETAGTPPGWYSDPNGSGSQRYWDGQKWTEHFAPGAPQAAPPAQKKRRGCLFWLVVVIVVLVIIGVISAIAGGGHSGSSGSVKSSAADKSTPGSGGGSSNAGSGPGSKGAVGTKKNPAPQGTAVQNKSARYQVDGVAVQDSLGDIADKPSGKYVVVTLTVSNVKKSTIHISSSDFTLNVAGTAIDASDNGIFLDGAFNYDDLSPGLKRTGKIVFDVAPAQAGKGVLVAQALLSVDEPVYLKLK